MRKTVSKQFPLSDVPFWSLLALAAVSLIWGWQQEAKEQTHER